MNAAEGDPERALYKTLMGIGPQQFLFEWQVMFEVHSIYFIIQLILYQNKTDRDEARQYLLKYGWEESVIERLELYFVNIIDCLTFEEKLSKVITTGLDKAILESRAQFREWLAGGSENKTA